MSPASSALGVLAATSELLGDVWMQEPETIWLQVDPPIENRARLQAAVALLNVPAFYWDGIVFEKTALAFDGMPPNPDTLEEADVHQLAWAVEEAARVLAWHKDEAKEFLREPAAYAAVVMHRDGFVVAPEKLAFAQDLLDGMNAKAASLREEVEKAWADLDKGSMDIHAFPETPVGIQLARLAGVTLHCADRRRQLDADLASLKG